MVHCTFKVPMRSHPSIPNHPSPFHFPLSFPASPSPPPTPPLFVRKIRYEGSTYYTMEMTQYDSAIASSFNQSPFQTLPMVVSTFAPAKKHYHLCDSFEYILVCRYKKKITLSNSLTAFFFLSLSTCTFASIFRSHIIFY